MLEKSKFRCRLILTLPIISWRLLDERNSVFETNHQWSSRLQEQRGWGTRLSQTSPMSNTFCLPRNPSYCNRVVLKWWIDLISTSNVLIICKNLKIITCDVCNCGYVSLVRRISNVWKLQTLVLRQLQKNVSPVSFLVQTAQLKLLPWCIIMVTI